MAKRDEKDEKLEITLSCYLSVWEFICISKCSFLVHSYVFLHPMLCCKVYCNYTLNEISI